MIEITRNGGRGYVDLGTTFHGTAEASLKVLLYVLVKGVVEKIGAIPPSKEKFDDDMEKIKEQGEKKQAIPHFVDANLSNSRAM